MPVRPPRLDRLLAALLLVASACGEAPPPTGTYATVQEACLAEWLAWERRAPGSLGRGGPPMIVLRRMSTTSLAMGMTEEVPPALVREELPGLREDTWRAFQRANDQAHDLSGLVACPVPLTLRTGEDLDRDIGTGDDPEGREVWARYYAAHPGALGVMTMSMPGLSADGSQALLYIGQSHGYLAGSGYLHLLVREGTGWRVVASSMLWIS